MLPLALVLERRAEFSGQTTGPPAREIRVMAVFRALLDSVRTAVAAIVGSAAEFDECS